MRKVIIAILSVIAVATVVLPEGEYGPVTITSLAADGQFNSNGLQANNLGIPIDEFIDAPETAPSFFGEFIDAPETIPSSFNEVINAPMTAPVIETSATTTTAVTTTEFVSTSEILDTAPATAPEVLTTTTSTTTTSAIATMAVTTTTTTILADMKCADGAEVRVSEDSNGKVEIEASGEKDLLKEIFSFIKDLFV